LISQRDIIEVPFNLPQGTVPHPAIVLSTDEAIQEEESFVAVMLTSEDYNDLYSFPITNSMLTKPMTSAKSQARLHLISFFRNSDVIPTSHVNHKIRPEYFKILIGRINEVTFGVTP
jgi:hypothetical protein